MYSTNEFRRGLKVEIDGEPYVMVESQFVKPGKGQAFTRTKLKSLITGNVIDRTYKSGERLAKADLEEHTMQFLYAQGDDEFHFMNTESYEQVQLTREQLGDAWQWLTENLDVSMLFYKGNPIAVEVPIFVELEITETEPGVRGDTAQGGTKPAVLSTGAKVNVPLFVEQGEWIKVDTRTGSYIERVKR